ncbi:MAG TPA: TonB-dependent receptor [Bryobacteraceae bacterium]|nr:TonB-dependent receptor [Bryobacteraceae bacterium]
MRLLRVAENALIRPAMSLPLCLAVFLAAAFSQFSYGQNFTSSITGTVTDPSGAAVVGATLALQNTATNAAQETVSQDNGTYQFTNLNPGTYQLTVTVPGFKTYVREKINLQAQVESTVNIPLEIGGTEQKVEVTASATLVDTETANKNVTLDTRLIQSLPNSTRNPLNFVFAIAGTTIAPGGQTQTGGTFDQMSSNFGINGGRTGEETVLIDGAPSQALDWGGLMVAPMQDSVQEQQVLVNTYDAEYEKGGAGIVTMITRGGSNAFHGEAYDYLQNDALNANSWYNNRRGIAKGEFKQNQFGGNIGGPILKRYNLFFFGAYEGLRQPNTQNTLTTVPTQEERNGDFSHTLNASGGLATIYNPFSTTAVTGNASGYTRAPFAGNQVPSNLMNPVGQKIVSLYPLPNRPGEGANHLNNYYNQGAAMFENDKMDVRGDWQQNQTHRMFFRWSQRFRQDQNYPCFFCNGADTNNNQQNVGYQGVLNDTITPSPTWVINAFVSYSRWQEAHIPQGTGVANAATIGLNPALFQAPVLPSIGADNGYTGLGNGWFARYTRYADTAQLNLTKVLSRHTLKFGASYTVGQMNVVNESVGSLNFSSALTSCDPDASGKCAALNYSSSLTGNPIASMLLGTASGGGTGINFDPALSLHSYGFYIQDQWRVTPRLTVNAGLRYENQRPATERFNRLTIFDPHVVSPISGQVAPVIGRQVLGGMEYASSGNRYLWESNNRDFAPRLGIAYKITDKLVARAGAGIFFLPPTAMLGDDTGLGFGFSSSTDYIATTQNGFVPLNLVSNPFPNGINQPTGGSQGLMTMVGDGVSYGAGIWPKQKHPTPYTEQWSFDLQYQVGARGVLEAGYTGNRGKKLLYGNPGLDLDQLPTADLALGTAVLDHQVPNPFAGVANSNTWLGSPDTKTIPYNQLLRPFPQYWALQLQRSYSGASSHFDALYIKYNHTFNAGLSLLTTYQWSKAMDNGPEDFFGWATGNQWRDFYNTRLDYNISTHDVPQSFVTALVYDLPYGSGKTWGSNAPAVVRAVAGGWQVSSVVRLASGLPLGPVVANPWSNPLNNYGFPGSLLSDWVGNPQPGDRTPDNWINPKAFAAPVFQTINGDPNNVIYRYGTAPQRMAQLRERAARNVDFSVAKNLGTERYQAWLRGEFMNFFNYAQYNSMCTDLSQQSCYPFGAAQNTENAPRMIQLSVKLVF